MRRHLSMRSLPWLLPVVALAIPSSVLADPGGVPNSHASPAAFAATENNSHALIVHGHQNADGSCTSDGVSLGTMHRGEADQMAVEVNSDPSSCTQTYAVGDATAQTSALGLTSVMPTVYGGSSVSASSNSTGATVARVRHRRARAHAAGTPYNAYFYEVAQDPDGAWAGAAGHISVVQNTVSWWQGYGCLSNSGNHVESTSAWGGPYIARTYFDFPHAAYCSYLYSATGAHYTDVYGYYSCGAQSGWSNYWRNTIFGYDNGSFSPYAGLKVWNGCDSPYSWYTIDKWGWY